MLQHTFVFLLFGKHKIFLPPIFLHKNETKFNVISQYFLICYISVVTVAYMTVLLWPVMCGSGLM